jgi:threonine/homoserine/homoserine lactone efflux protein
VPQFVPPQAPLFGAVLTLGVIDTVVALAWLVIIVLVATRTVVWLREPRVATLLSRISAAILTAFGLATVASADQR